MQNAYKREGTARVCPVLFVDKLSVWAVHICTHLLDYIVDLPSTKYEVDLRLVDEVVNIWWQSDS